MRYFDDLRIGQRIDLGSTAVSEAEILEFGRRYDPQPFHTDPVAAKESVFGGLVASGWHTCALFMRLLAAGLLNDMPSLGSPGVDEVRWLAPVRPGDTLAASLTVLEMRPSRRRPERGVARSRGEMTNQDGETVLTMIAISLIGRRPPA